MSHEDLIITLASKARPVTPLRAPAARAAGWVVSALVVVGLAVAWRGLRHNWTTAFADPTFVITNVLIVIVGILSAWTSLTLAVPGAMRSRQSQWAPIAGLGAWGAILIQQMASGGDISAALMTEPVVSACLWKTYGIAVGPALVIILMARRAAPLDWRWTIGLAGLSALAFGAVGTDLICPIAGAAHLFNWHFLPVAMMTLAAFLAGGFWRRK